MYWAFDKDREQWRPAVQAEWYDRKGGNTTTLDFAKCRKKQKPVWADQIVPVDLHEDRTALSPSNAALSVPTGLDTAVKRLNFMRFGIETQEL
jgi:hypothetical protein